MHGQVGQVRDNIARSQFVRVLFLVIDDKSSDPAHIGNFRMEAVVALPACLSNLVEEFGGGHRVWRFLDRQLRHGINTLSIMLFCIAY